MRTSGTTLAAAAVLVTAGCSPQAATLPPARTVIRLVADTTTSQPLALAYARSLPDLTIQLTEGVVGSGSTVAALQRGEADLGFVLADVAYFANLALAEHPDPSLRTLRGIAALQTAPIHLLVRRDLPIDEIGSLRGLNVRTNAAFASQSLLAQLVFRAYGLDIDDLRSDPLIRDFLVRGGNLDGDAAFVTAYYPAQSVRMATSLGAKLIPIAGPIAEHLRHEYPFVRDVSIPAHTYPGQADPVMTIGVNRLLVCRADLDERIVHDLTQQLINALPSVFASRRVSPRLMDLDEVSATPIPLHKGAAQYYRERELTP
jgi:TRAP transporter TAXI family solute receptor